MSELIKVVRNHGHPHTKKHAIYTIAVIGFIYTLHIVVPMYSNSSFIEILVNEKMVGYIYMLSAATTILGYLLAPSWIRKLGNYKMSMTLIFMQILLFFGIIYSTSTGAIITFFIIQAAVISLIGLSLDIFLEAYTDGMHAGTVRGLYTATLNASWVIGPLIGSMILDDGSDYKKTYIVALAMLFPLLYLIHKNFPRFKDPNYTHPSLWHLIKHVSHHHSWVRVFYANVVLQIFYSWMTIYVPIYLHKTLGFGWEDLGIIFVAMLLPFPTIQYPLGKLADKKYGEKEIMCAGFAIMGIATVALSFIGTPNIWLWSIGLFTTRIGAAAVEIMLETYFFKTVSSTDTPVLGLFRMTRPLSTFLTPLIPLTALYFWPNLEYPWMFVIVGLFTLLALIPAITLKDTK